MSFIKYQSKFESVMTEMLSDLAAEKEALAKINETFKDGCPYPSILTLANVSLRILEQKYQTYNETHRQIMKNPHSPQSIREMELFLSHT